MTAGRAFPSQSIPTDDAIAAALGIEDLRLGRHFLRDEGGKRAGSIWLDTYWMLRVKPSFDDHGLVGVAAAHGEESKGVKPPGWIKAVLSCADALVVWDIEADPLPPFLSRLPLLRSCGSMFLDGVGYELRSNSLDVHANLRFSNPVAFEFVTFEAACLQLAQRIARASGNQALIRFGATWAGYCTRT